MCQVWSSGSVRLMYTAYNSRFTNKRLLTTCGYLWPQTVVLGHPFVQNLMTASCNSTMIAGEYMTEWTHLHKPPQMITAQQNVTKVNARSRPPPGEMVFLSHPLTVWP